MNKSHVLTFKNNPSSIVTSNLVAHYDAWSYNGSSTWNDISGNNYHATLTNCTFDKTNGASIYFNGTNAYMYTPNINAGGAFTTIAETIEMWIYPTSANCVFCTETKVQAINSNWHCADLILYNGYWYAAKWNGYHVVTLLGKARLNEWNHVVWRQTVQGNSVVSLQEGRATLDGFLNGSVSTMEQCQERQTPWINSGDTVYMLGVAPDSTTYGTANYPQGKIAVIRVYSRALSNTEILQNYNAQRQRFYIKNQPQTSPMWNMLFAGNGTSNIEGGWLGYFESSYVHTPTDFDFYFYGVNYGRGQNGSIYMMGNGALGFGAASTTTDWQASTGKALLLSFYGTRGSPYFYASGNNNLGCGAMEKTFSFNFYNSNSQAWEPYHYYHSYWSYNYNWGGYYYYNDTTTWSIVVRMVRSKTHQFLDIRCRTNGNTQGRWQISDGSTLANMYSLWGGQSQTLVSDRNGYNWSNYNAYYINEGFASDILDNYQMFIRYSAQPLYHMYTSGSVVTTWPNSANSTSIDMTATSVNGPTLGVERNRNYYVHFSRGSSQYFTIPQLCFDWIQSWAGMTILCVGRFNSPVWWDRIFDFGNGTPNDNIILAEANGNWTVGAYNGGTQVSQNYGTTNPTMSNWRVFICTLGVSGSTTTTVYYDNSTSATNTWTSNIALANRTTYTNYIGRSLWADPYLEGDIAEIIIIKGAMPAGVCADLITYFKGRYEITY